MSTNGNGKNATTATITARVSVEMKQDFRQVMEELDLNESQGLTRLMTWAIANRRLPDDTPDDERPTLPFGREEEPKEPDIAAGLLGIMADAVRPTRCGKTWRRPCELLPEILRGELAAAAVLISRLALGGHPSTHRRRSTRSRQAFMTGRLQKEVMP